MSNLVYKSNMELNGEEIETYFKIPKQPIFLTDIDRNTEPNKALSLSLTKLALEKEVAKVGTNTSENLLEAKYLFCEDLDEYI